MNMNNSQNTEDDLIQYFVSQSRDEDFETE